MCRLILLDLDGTLLRPDKTISDHTLSVLCKCREKGLLLGISTARGESNAVPFIESVRPDLVISSGGALVRYAGELLFSCALSPEKTAGIIRCAFELTQGQCEITVDTPGAHYWNYKEDPHILYPDWGEVRYTDYQDFHEPALKITVELPDDKAAEKIAMGGDCDFVHFSDGNWYKFSRKEATKAKAIHALAERPGIRPEEIIAFGDDFADMEMLRVCGRGIAMGNALPQVKEIADAVTLSNDEDGVAMYLEKLFL